MHSLELKNKAAKIKMAVFDVDGVMTDGSITYDENGVEYKTFNVKDGQGIVRITKAGIITAIITARNNEIGLQNQIDKFNLRKYFKKVYVVNSGKNTSELKAEILKKENVIKFIGDTSSDKKASDIADVEFEHYNNGFHSKEIVWQI